MTCPMRLSRMIILFSALLLSLFISTSLLAQNYQDTEEIVFVIKPTDFKKKAKSDIAKKHNAILKEAVTQYWESNITYKFLEERPAYKYAKTKKGKIIVAELETIIEVGTVRVETNFNFRTHNTSKILSVRLPSMGLEKKDIIYALMHSQFMYKNLTRFKKPSKELPKAYGHLLKEKTLLIAASDLSKGFTETDLKNSYPYEFKVVSDEELR